MAPATRDGYTLLPSDDITAAGGPVICTGNRSGALQEDTPHPHEEEVDQDGPAKHINYDGGIRFDSSASPWVIHPYNRNVQIWNAVLVCILISDVVWLPIETAFGRTLSKFLMFWFNMLSTMFFTTDMVLQFFLQIPSSTGDYWIFNHSKIIRSYLRNAFFIDLLSVLPFNEIHAVISFSARAKISTSLYLLHILRFKLLRMVRLKRILKRYMYDINLTFTQRAVANSGITFLVSLHIMSCVWATLGNYQDGDDWLSQLIRLKTKEGGANFYPALDTRNGVGLGKRTGEDSVVTYVTSIYFALYTLSGIGYGDINPATVPEYLFLILLMLGGSLIWCTVIGEMVSVMKHANLDEVSHKETMDALLLMSREYNFSRKLKMRLKEYFLQWRTTTRTNFVQEKVMARMSSELAIQLAHVLHRRWFDGIWWLRNVSRTTFMVQLTLAFDPMLYCPNENIRTTDRLYVIQRGLCVHGRQLLTKDKCWGVDMLLTQDHLRVSLTTVSITYLHVLYLTRDALQKTLERFPREQELVRKAYRTLCFIRGVVWKARQYQRMMAQRQGSHLGSGSVLTEGDFMNRLGATDGQERTLRPSQALASRATTGHISKAIRSAQDMITDLDKNLKERLAKVDEKVNDAQEIVGSVLRSRKSR